MGCGWPGSLLLPRCLLTLVMSSNGHQIVWSLLASPPNILTLGIIRFQIAVCVSESPERPVKNTDPQVLSTHETKGRSTRTQPGDTSEWAAHHTPSEGCNPNSVATKPALPDGLWYSEVTQVPLCTQTCSFRQERQEHGLQNWAAQWEKPRSPPSTTFQSVTCVTGCVRAPRTCRS